MSDIVEEPFHKWKGFFEDLRNRPTTGLPNPPLKGWDCGMAIVQKKKYAEKYQGRKKNIIAVGVNFKTDKGAITDWRGIVYSSEGKKHSELRPSKDD